MIDEQKNELATVSTVRKAGLAKQAGGKVKQTKSAPTVAISSSADDAIATGKLELQRHFDTLQQIGSQVATAKVEMSRAMPDLIAQKEREILAENPIDIDAGARRVREAVMSESVQSMLAEMGLELSYED